MNEIAPGHDPYAALKTREFRLLFAGNVVGAAGGQMQTVAVAWEIYERTGSAFALGGTGLAQILPVLLLAPFAGVLVDKLPRRRVLMTAQLVIACAALGLWFVTSMNIGGIAAIYACLLLAGTARAFQAPARTALLPQVVPRERFPNAVTWASGGFQLASVAGPALGGAALAGWGRAAPVFLVNACAALMFLALVKLIRAPRADTPEVETSEPIGEHATIDASTWRTRLDTLVAGFRFVWRTPILLAAVSLDMFAVLLGGATALMPIYARDILHVGAPGLGWLRAAPAFGAILMTIMLAHMPPLRHAGRTLLLAVAGFGAATIVFGVSRSYPLSLLMLFALGALDQISVVVRSTLVQLSTPDEMRGRVSAVNGMFVGASNELGAFESGAAAALLGPVAAVVSGGIGTILVVLATAKLSPALRFYGALGGLTEADTRGANDGTRGGAPRRASSGAP